MVATGLKVKNATIDFTLEPIAAADKVHWKLSDTSAFHFDSFSIDMKNSILQKIVNECSGLIAKMINKEMPNLSKKLDSIVQNLNGEIAKEGPLTFAVPVRGNTAINLTMSQAPDLSTPNLVKVFFDGLILENNKTKQTIKGITAPPRIQHFLSEQVWLHQEMVESLLEAGSAEIFPLSVDSKSISDQMK